MTTGGYPKKLIEVALPLDEINAACKADKDRKTGTIRNLHKWFAPMPLPAWRALIFAVLVDDPADDEKRAYLLDVIKRLVANGADLPDAETVDEARKIIAAQFPNGVPRVMDPFCGGGSTLVEARRLGLSTFGSDLNPVPVLITRTLTELVPKVYGRQPLHGVESTNGGPTANGQLLAVDESPRIFRGYDGLAHDVMYYGAAVRNAAWNALKKYFPTTQGETPVAWIWARTARCPSPACGIETLLTTSLWLSIKKGELAWVEPTVRDGRVYLDVVMQRRTGAPPPSPKIGRGASFACLGCGQVIDDAALRLQAASSGLGLRLVAVAASTPNGRVYRSPRPEEEEAALKARPERESLEVPLANDPRSIWCVAYGVKTQADLYTPRQLLVLMTFADAVAGVHAQVQADGGDAAWADAVTTMLGLAVGQLARSGSTQCLWRPRPTAHGKAESAFGRNDLPMMWDFAETFFMGGSVGDWSSMIESMCRALSYASTGGESVTVRADARTISATSGCLVATDPPYFDAVGYADLSDYFYVWHRRALKSVHPDLYATVAAPKAGELTALPSHHGNSKDAARAYFIEGFTETFTNLQDAMGSGLPILIVYASKEQKGGREEETRWSSILTAMVQADLEITGTWPIHGTSVARMISAGTNAVATYVVMVCRPRPPAAGTCSLSDFNRALRRELRPAVHDFQAAGILPVDLAQAAMGPGMQVYSRYRQVLDQAGDRVSVEQALRLINAALGEVLDEQEGELDAYSRFAVAWWEKHSWDAAAFGEADQLARPQGISVDDVIRAEVVYYPKPGFVALLGSDKLDRAWKPASDSRPTAWEAVHHLADRLISGSGEVEGGRLMRELGTLRDPAQALVYRLHDIAAKKGRTKDQERYNALIGSWSNLLAIAASQRDELF